MSRPFLILASWTFWIPVGVSQAGEPDGRQAAQTADSTESPLMGGFDSIVWPLFWDHEERFVWPSGLRALFELHFKIGRIEVSDDKVLEVTTVSPRRILVTTKKHGKALVTFTRSDEHTFRMYMTVSDRRTYHSKTTIVRIDANGEERHEASTEGTAFEGSPSNFFAGTTTLYPPDDVRDFGADRAGTWKTEDEVEEMAAGLGVRRQIFRAGGKVFLDLTLRNTTAQKDGENRFHLSTSELRAVEPLQLGEKIKLFFPGTDVDGSRFRAELIFLPGADRHDDMARDDMACRRVN